MFAFIGVSQLFPVHNTTLGGWGGRIDVGLTWA